MKKLNTFYIDSFLGFILEKSIVFEKYIYSCSVLIATYLAMSVRMNVKISVLIQTETLDTMLSVDHSLDYLFHLAGAPDKRGPSHFLYMPRYGPEHKRCQYFF